MGLKLHPPSFILLALLLTLLLPVSSPFKKDIYEVKVVRILDGDTIEVDFRGRLIKVRLAYVDAPEISQKDIENKEPIGLWARDFLVQKIQGKSIMLKKLATDKYQRMIGEIRLNNELINLSLIQAGFAIVYPFSQFSSRFQKEIFYQQYYQAFNQEKGIWNTLGMVNPYHYRQEQKRPGRLSH